LRVIPPLITTNLTYHWQKKKLQNVFSEQEQDHYITMREIGQIRKDIERECINISKRSICFFFLI
jgi:hypothetical protein